MYSEGECVGSRKKLKCINVNKFETLLNVKGAIKLIKLAIFIAESSKLIR